MTGNYTRQAERCNEFQRRPLGAKARRTALWGFDGLTTDLSPREAQSTQRVREWVSPKRIGCVACPCADAGHRLSVRGGAMLSVILLATNI